MPVAEPRDQETRRFRSISYMPPLDGVRAFAVLAVMAFHGGVGWAGGGFLGVDAFFVLSGYLITSLLVAEWGRTGSIGLGSFWSRRARRLLPALFLVLVAVALYGALFVPADSLGSLRSEALSTLGYAANWHQIAAGQNYFAQQALPSPLMHTWSLAIEEQFYIVWPLVVLGLLRWRRSLRALLGVGVLGALASALTMALLYTPGGDPGRVYYGTDTRAQSLLVGAALAIVLARRTEPLSRRGGRALSGAAAIGAGVVLWMWVTMTGTTTWLYRGGFLIGALSVAAVIACSVLVPTGTVARVLAVAPLRFVGKISYGLYLWHWPIFLLLDHARTGLEGPALLVLRLAVTLAVSVASYYLVERPVRNGSFRSWRAWTVTPVAAGGTALAVLVATAPAVSGLPLASAPGTSISSVSALNRGAPPVVPRTRAAQATGPGGPLQGPLDPSPPIATGPLGRPARILVVGDSVAQTTGIGLRDTASQFGAVLVDAGVLGCGVARGGPMLDRGNVDTPLSICEHWPQMWASDVSWVNPDVAVVMSGPWEVLDRYHNGRYEHLGEPDFDAYIAQELELMVQVLGAKGAQVVFFTSPYYNHGEQPDGSPWPQDDPARVDRYNALLEQVAARHPDRVSVIPVGAMLSPGGHFSTVVDGVVARFSDGVHVTEAAGAQLAPKVFPELSLLASLRQGGAPGPGSGPPAG